MKKDKTPVVINDLLVTDIAVDGKALGKHENKVIFIEHAIPGDVVNVQLVKNKSNYAESFVLQTLKFSDKRTEPFCKHFGKCGGCKWQDMNYETQLFYKQKFVTDNLQHIAKIKTDKVFDILASDKTKFYRNKLEFTFSNKKWLTPQEFANPEIIQHHNALGFHVPGRFDKVLHIEECFLQNELSNNIRNFIFDYAIQNNLSFFDLKLQQGFLRTLIVRTTSTGETMVILSFFENNQNAIKALLDALITNFKTEITTLLYVVNSKRNDTIADLDIQTFHGNGYIVEQMENLKFKIGPKSFYQTNSQQAYALYKQVRNFANFMGNELVYDLYTGTGTIALFVAKNVKKVIGIEYVEAAITDAKDNAKFNNIDNADFFAGDIKNVLTNNFVAQHGKPDVIITDPPRAGMHTDVVNKILEIAPKKIIYVSCNPSTQARDLTLLTQQYSVEAIQPVDMFPHTHHVENIVLLKHLKG